MLQLIKITKDYKVADGYVHALKGIDITFRDNEFVSVLGPSGCGKTTLLNIIGGLDHYTDGDLFIEGISTKKFNDRDWDTYRNHRIGFIFQSYNLIPHQSILENVELALTIAGIGKEERIKRAKDALDKVGLKDQYHKKPNQLSGGQCQRVAIARALVNEPEILLADEPTGALDTKTSVQIMELIKDIAKERLVIMVTHNPELAEKYSTRIVRLLDGNIISDSNPYQIQEIVEIKKSENEKNSKLSFWTAFRLSARNLRSKFKRTLMVCIAGSIGIVGVASVLSVSTGVQNYIHDMEDDMLSGNPITIDEETMNLSAMLSGASMFEKTDALQHAVSDGKINVDSLVEYLISRSDAMNSFMVNNNITEEYVQFVSQMPEEYYSAMATYFGIDVTNNFYTDVHFANNLTQTMSLSAIKQVYTSMLEKTDYAEYASLITSLSDTFIQSPGNEEFILSQYDIISDPNTSKIAQEANEIMIVVDDESSLTDLLLTQLGYYTQEEFFNIIYKASGSDLYDPSLDKDQFDYDELLGKKFTYYPNDTVYEKNEMPLAATNPFDYNAYEDSSWNNGLTFTITAILRPKENISYGCLQSGLYYTPSLTKKILTDSLSSEIVTYLIENEKEGFNSMNYNGTDIGITYKYSYFFEGTQYDNVTGYVGTMSQLNFLMGTATGQTMPSYYTLSLREVGGINSPSSIRIYPKDFTYKDEVTNYLSTWNSDEDLLVGDKLLTADERDEIIYTDNLSIIISMINNMISIVTSALVAFTALSLVVSTVMIAIITYVSVIERVKEIGVIRSLGGRKKDVARLFNAETFIIGGIAGIIGIAVTYLISLIINLIVGSLSGIYTLATLPIHIALIMIVISILLTSISGLIPASLAAKKDPVDALRSE